MEALKRCTIKDIAISMRLTPNTVSRALKNKEDISKKTCELVQKKAKELGYVQNLAASSLRSGKSNTVAIVYDNILNPYYSIMTNLIDRRLKKEGYSILIFSDQNVEAELSEATVKKILAHKVDGVVSFLQVGTGIKMLFDAYNIPIVILGRHNGEGVTSIFTDDEKGGYLATKHLIERGHEDIIMLNGKKTISCSTDRFNGYKLALEENNLEVKEENVLNIATDGWNGSELIEQAFLKNLKFSAIFCFNDMIAQEILVYLQCRQYVIPKDFAIIGYDNIQQYIRTPYRLSTIDTSSKLTAETAVEIIMKKIDGINDANGQIVHDITLVTGMTT